MRPAQLLALFLDAGLIHDRAPAQASLDEIDRTALEPRERRAQEGEELCSTSPAPVVPEQREQRGAERRLAEPQRVLNP